MTNNQCVQCGQWSGKGHKCPTQIPPRTPNSPKPAGSPVPGVSGSIDPTDLSNRVARARNAVARQTREDTQAVEYFEQNTIRQADGTYVWRSNGQAPFDDMLERWQRLSLISEQERAATNSLREEKTLATLAAYAAARANREPSGEELYEMRAAFGNDAVVVDVVTGQRINLAETNPRYRDADPK